MGASHHAPVIVYEQNYFGEVRITAGNETLANRTEVRALAALGFLFPQHIGAR